MGSTYKKTEIKKSATPKRIDDFSAFIKKLEDDVASAGLKYAPNLMKRFVCALLAKPFVVLTGLSGSGKTKLAQAFAEWIAVKNTSLVVPVGADWTNSERLLGYPNALESGKYVLPETRVLEFILDASENKDVPFFLVLDEMNLSHVERYFADFLSAMESGDEIKLYSGEKRHASNGREIPQTLAFPKNLFVIGTMNVDETTYMFSPKVLDRAQVIEFRVSKDEMSAFLSAPSNLTLAALAGKGAEYAEAFQRLADARKDKKPTDESLAGIKNALDGFFPPLSELGAEFGYRTAIEIVTFVAYYIEAKAEVDNAIDAAIVQKLLPKLHGSQARLGPVLKKLKELASKKTVKEENGERKEVVAPLYRLTCDKLARMQERLKANGFTSFAEA
jgi:5-methylcytosine-specific restriction protein B